MRVLTRAERGRGRHTGTVRQRRVQLLAAAADSLVRRTAHRFHIPLSTSICAARIRGERLGAEALAAILLEREEPIAGLFPEQKARPVAFDRPTIFISARVHPGEVTPS